jgi:hypothetical protein
MTGPRKWLRSTLALALAGISPAAVALCSGFTDVNPGGLCPSVDWLRNRAITTGCTSATLFCPFGTVHRLQMAVFMNRLGTALTPTIGFDEDGGASLNLASSPTVCAVDLAGATYPRSASVDAILTTLAGPTTGLSMHVVVSTNGGATWTPATQNAHPLVATPGVGGWMTGYVTRGAIPLAVNTAYRFGLQLIPNAGTTALAAWSCQLKSLAASRTGSAEPY